MNELDRPRRNAASNLAWSIHAMTASGVVVGLLGLVAVSEGRPREALLWVIAAIVLDGVDGPLARRINCREVLPQMDGYVLDLVVDFVTCVILPAMFILQFDMVDSRVELLAAAGMVFTGALWFARTDQMTDDHWFKGFPASWNVVVPTLFLTGANQTSAMLVVVAFCALTLSTVKFVHPVQVREHRAVTLPVVGAWVITMTVLSVTYPTVPPEGIALLIAGSLYLVFITIRRTLQREVPLELVISE